MKLNSIEFEQILETISAAVILFNEDSSIRYFNSYLSVITGLSIEEMEEENTFDPLIKIIHEDDIERYLRAKKICSIGEDALVRFRVKHQSGLVLWLETRMVPIFSDDAESNLIMSITIDVTDSIQYQKQIEEQNQDLNDFAYMVSHDLKAPIFTIQGMADALKEDYGNVIGDDGRKLLDYITNAASRLTMLVESVLEYSALTNSDDTLSDVSLEDLIPNVISDYSEKLKNIDSKIQLVNQLPFIKGEPVRIYQLFSNLIGNAIKYRKLDKTLEILISSSNISPGYAQIDISDNGIGIHENKLEDIFRPYRRAQSRDTEGEDIEGSGIGLACVKKIVDKIGGRVSVSSKLNKGSTFSLILPLSKPSERKIPKDLERLF